MRCVCCTKAKWWPNTFAVTSADRSWCCRSTAWKRSDSASAQRSKRWSRNSTPGDQKPGPFHLHLNSRPVKTSVHLRRLLGLAQVYGRTEVLAAIARALELQTYDAAYVENLLLAERRRRQLPTPTRPTPQRRELIDDIELGTGRSRPLRPLLSRHRGEFPWHNLTSHLTEQALANPTGPRPG